MMRAAVGVVVLALTHVLTANAQRPGRPLLEDVARAMGGKERVLAVRTLLLEGAGETYNLGQNKDPGAPMPAFAVTDYRRGIDFANRRWRQELTRVPRFPTGVTTPQRIRIGFDGVAYSLGADGAGVRAAGRADEDRANELLHHPIGFLQVALGTDAEVTEETAQGGLRHVRMNTAGNKFAIFIDPRTKLPARITKVTYDAMLGDLLLQTQLSDWRSVDGLMVPMRIAQRYDDRFPLSSFQLSAVRIDADVGDLSAPANVRSAASPAPTINVTSEEIAPGVWYLAGQSHHSVAIEMRDHLLLVEAPQSEARTLAVIRRARELRPGKPVRAVINTHHHFDHASGVRAAISEGLQVMTHSGNRRWFEEIAQRRHSIVVDALAASKRPARIDGIDGRRVISDGTRRVEVHHVRGSAHSNTMLMVYLPSERILVEADVYSPPAANATTVPAMPFVANLMENIDRLGLQVDRVAALHGRVVPMSEVRAAAAANGAVQGTELTRADSALVARVLLAEDRRDASDASLADGMRHGNARVRDLARRANGRIGDARFVARDSLPALTPPTVWPEPAWRLRLRAVPTRNDCSGLRVALADSAWPVRLRAADSVASPCAQDAVIAQTLRGWVYDLRPNAVRRSRGEVAWQGAAHAIVALARIEPAQTRPRIVRLASHRQWQVRAYAARAAAVVSDTATLVALARDADDNVKEVAIEALAKLGGHAFDDVYLATIENRKAGQQAIRVAAVALKGTQHPRANVVVIAAFHRLVARNDASTHDTRKALLEVAGRPLTDDRAPAIRVTQPPRLVSLALGEDVRLRVRMSPGSGGGSFVVRLRGDVAPMMAARILELARSRYYDGLAWHRVEHDFVVQGGSPRSNEYVGLPQFLRDELGTLPHRRGTVGMSTRGHDTGDAQWFFNLKDNLRLGRDYTVFAEVVEGMEVVDGILEGDVIARIEEVRSK